eukprot:1826428-Ditylum_brightwellii.AAC.1
MKAVGVSLGLAKKLGVLLKLCDRPRLVLAQRRGRKRFALPKRWRLAVAAKRMMGPKVALCLCTMKKKRTKKRAKCDDQLVEGI